MTDPESGDEEGLPASIQEAMGHGLAVVSTKHAGIPEAIETGKTGILVDEGDVKAMSSAMIEIQPQSISFGTAAFAYAKNNYSWSMEKERLHQWLGIV